jgi:hypothetical protein
MNKTSPKEKKVTDPKTNVSLASARRASPDQIASIRGMSHRLTGSNSFALVVAGEPKTAIEADRIMRALHQVDMNRKVGETQDDHRRLLCEQLGITYDPDLHAVSSTASVSVVENLVAKTGPIEGVKPKPRGRSPKAATRIKLFWQVAIAEDLGIEGVAENCPRCGGTGILPGRVSKGTVGHVVFGTDPGAKLSPKMVYERLINPRLADLRRISQLIDSDLEDAVKWCERMAKEVAP